jgi:hypothetical protein
MMVIGMMILGTINSFGQNTRGSRQGFTIGNERNTQVERRIENNRGQQNMGQGGEMRGESNMNNREMGRNTYRMESMNRGGREMRQGGREMECGVREMGPMECGMVPVPQPVRYSTPVPVPVPVPVHPIGFIPTSPEVVTGMVVGGVITGLLSTILH